MADTPAPKTVSQAIGRRKTAIASVRLIAGTAEITVNSKPISTYFPTAAAKMRYDQPFKVLSQNKYTATIKVHGGGHTGQLDAVVLGLARALTELKADNRSPLRNAGLLTRDPRERQRRMIGMGGKSRRKKQSPKR